MKLIETKNAVGHVLCHDLTQIIRGVTKDARFRKGHVVTQEDIPVLLSMGKRHLYIWEKAEGMLHEDEAAERLRAICQGAHIRPTPVKEGKIELLADIDGLFRVDVDRLTAVNLVDEVIVATRRTNTPVRAGEKLAGTRVIPLVIAEETIVRAESAAGGRPLLELLPWKLRTAGLVVTGGEVVSGLVEDTFTPVILDKLAAYGILVQVRRLPGDDMEAIAGAILDCKAQGVDIILCAGGMSVDPDDRTPGAIKQAGVRVVAYGAPVLPGAMFLLGYFEDGTPVMGLPGCVMYAGATIFDLVLPRVAAGVPVSRADLVRLGHGGLCLGCAQCHYPICPFGACG
ncbi:MAG: molybdopterin-binding protein [Clostridiales bacterium]|nr:molybdopterin-binding protein [Clostridiales bacterium]